LLLVFAQEFERITDAIAAERQIKGGSGAKKEALIRGEMGWKKAKCGALHWHNASFDRALRAKLRMRYMGNCLQRA